MVKVIFYSLLRSKYNIKEEFYKAGTINEIIGQILERHTKIEKSDFRYGVVLYKGKPIHYHNFDTLIEDDEYIIFTHFVSGG